MHKDRQASLRLQTPRADTCRLRGVTRADSGGSKSSIHRLPTIAKRHIAGRETAYRWQRWKEGYYYVLYKGVVFVKYGLVSMTQGFTGEPIIWWIYAFCVLL